jgi:hypothetical protein
VEALEVHARAGSEVYRRGVTYTLRAAAAAVLALGLALPAGSADARAGHWTTVVRLTGAKAQACKVPTTKHGPWKVRFRVDATKATTSVRGSAEVDKGAHIVDGPSRTHWLQPGAMSKVHTLRMPRGPSYRLQVGLETDTTGVASAGSLSAITRC